jgi:hypothetical protein
MDRDQQRFLKNILNSVMRSAINRTLWGLPVWVTILIGLAAAGAMWHWKLF